MSRKIKHNYTEEHWACVQFEDGIISSVLKASELETENGQNIMDVISTVEEGMNCVAPWHGHMYNARLLCVNEDKAIVLNKLQELKGKTKSTAAKTKAIKKEKHKSTESSSKSAFPAVAAIPAAHLNDISANQKQEKNKAKKRTAQSATSSASAGSLHADGTSTAIKKKKEIAEENKRRANAQIETQQLKAKELFGIKQFHSTAAMDEDTQVVSDEVSTSTNKTSISCNAGLEDSSSSLYGAYALAPVYGMTSCEVTGASKEHIAQANSVPDNVIIQDISAPSTSMQVNPMQPYQDSYAQNNFANNFQMSMTPVSVMPANYYSSSAPSILEVSSNSCADCAMKQSTIDQMEQQNFVLRQEVDTLKKTIEKGSYIFQYSI